MAQYIYDPTDEYVYEIADEDAELDPSGEGFWFADADEDPDHEYFYEFLPEEVEFEADDE